MGKYSRLLLSLKLLFEAKTTYTTPTTMLKLALCVALVLAAVTADSHNNLENLIDHEVTEILKDDPNMNVASCAIKCDQLIVLLNDADEMRSDEQCQRSCECKLTNHKCHHDDNDK